MELRFKNNFIGYFLFYYRVVGNRLIFYLILSILISLLDGLGLAIFIPLLQTVNNQVTQPAGKETQGQVHYITDFIQSTGFGLTVTTIICFLLLVFIFKGFLKFVQLVYYARLKQLFLKAVRNKLVTNLQSLSYGAFVKLDAGRIQNTLTSEVGRLFLTMTSYFSSAQSFIMLSTYVALAFLANYQFAFLVCLGAALSNFIYKKLYKKTKKLSFEISERGADFNSFLIQAVHYFKYLKSTNRFAIYAEKLRKVIEETELLNKKIGYVKAIATSIKEPIIIAIVGGVILLQMGWLGANLNTIILSLLLFYRALSFLIAVQNDWQGFIENIGGMHSIATIAEQMHALKEVQGNIEPLSIQKGIHFQQVSFNYGSKKALDKVSLNIPVNKTIALIGESGSGKTTLANMIAGLILPDNGAVLIDNVSLKDLQLDLYRNKIGYISQESVIFNDTIFNNVTFWDKPTTENVKRFYKALKMAYLYDFVEVQPQKELTKLGDNGILISGGQKQRISIARELYKECEILIFDEATSALDSETEKIIQENIDHLHGSYTMVLIAHRLSTIKEADLIYLLENGRVTASGSFDEMISNSSRFKKMVSLQTV